MSRVSSYGREPCVEFSVLTCSVDQLKEDYGTIIGRERILPPIDRSLVCLLSKAQERGEV